MFKFNNFSVSYSSNFPILKNLNLKIHEGEKVALLGPSGAGKTTLLNSLYQQHEEKITFIHQHYGLVSQLSTFHNVYIGQLEKHHTVYNLLNLIRPQKKKLQQIEMILQDLGLQSQMLHRVGSLSGGQQQRTAIARAIYSQKKILLADEPVSSIDPKRAGEVTKLLLRSFSTVIASLHSVQYALEYYQRIIGIREGEILFDLPSSKVTENWLAQLYKIEEKLA